MKVGYKIEARTSLYEIECSECDNASKKFYVVTEIPMSFSVSYIPKTFCLCESCAKIKFPKFFNKKKRAKKDKTAPI